MYLLVSKHAISVVLMRDQGIQQPIYYISKLLVDVETRYLPLKKLALALVHATRKLPHYFQVHTVYVLTEYPLQSLLKKSDFTGQIAKWGTRLGLFDIWYRPRNSVKGQVLADFVTEFSPRREAKMVYHVDVRQLKIFVDVASSVMGAGARIVIITPKGIQVEHSFMLVFKVSNKEAKYEALLIGIRAIPDLGAQEVNIYLDARLVVNQVDRSFEAKDSRMIEYLQLVKQTIRRFQKGEVIKEPSIESKVNVSNVKVYEPCWMNPIVDFLAEDRVPDNEKEVERIRITAAQYWLSKDQRLYQRYFGGPYLLCLHPDKVEELLAELHEGACGNHWAEAKALANISDVDVKKFIWKNIVTRFGVSESLVSDNGLQFDSKGFCKYCSDLGIRNRYSTLAYPQSNSQAEATNKLDLLEEKREAIVIHLADYQRKLAWQYDRGVKVRDFVAGDLVLRKVVGNAQDSNAGKLAPNWE
ncbi:uncharacterized protein LOC142606367 [Castanea sativa]|uniref:uncharacterized protein LOC142606367 n=1 Tax=Castanea sativa TaxID=21020 RepID=UPI003F64B18C